jgi:hypothetical protein
VAWLHAQGARINSFTVHLNFNRDSDSDEGTRRRRRPWWRPAAAAPRQKLRGIWVA